MMLDWNTYQQQLLVGIGQIGKISPDTFEVIASSAAPGNHGRPRTLRPLRTRHELYHRTHGRGREARRNARRNRGSSRRRHRSECWGSWFIQLG